jgi:hypothetical protein
VPFAVDAAGDLDPQQGVALAGAAERVAEQRQLFARLSEPFWRGQADPQMMQGVIADQAIGLAVIDPGLSRPALR